MATVEERARNFADEDYYCLAGWAELGAVELKWSFGTGTRNTVARGLTKDELARKTAAVHYR
jgi:hypothetical protein